MLLRKPLAHRTLEDLTREVSLCVVLCSLNSSFDHKRLQEVNLQSAGTAALTTDTDTKSLSSCKQCPSS